MTPSPDTTRERAADLPAVLSGWSGPTRGRLLVLHGWGQGAAHWAPVARRTAAEGITLLCPDLAALADSCQAAAGSAERLREVVRRLAVAARRAEVPAIVAHSAGAAVGVLLAHEVATVSVLVLVDPLAHQLGLAAPPPPRPGPATADPGPWPGTPLERLRARYPFAAEETLRTIAAHPSGADPPDAAGPQRAATDPDRAAAVRSALRTLPAELLLLRGAYSALLPAEDARRVVAAAPRGGCRLVPAAGHSVHVDQPRATAELLTRAMTHR
ncbi:alpha/beta fold hydrolase [Streptomyces sp. NPDC057702]|uniref:alpha/beta fold hydrolase n=1 Tax=unclassified Streptomyces TaxID=2593676 RepID=UPI0036BB9DB2